MTAARRMCVKTVMREDGVTIQPQITDVGHAIKVSVCFTPALEPTGASRG